MSNETRDALDRLIEAGNALSFAAQISGGVAGRDEGIVIAIEGWTKARDALRTPPSGETPDARDVTVPARLLLDLLDHNLEAANIALALHSSIDFIEAHGGAESEDDMERVAYHLFYGLFAAEKLRAAMSEASRDA